MSRYKRYERYKDSGVEWIGEIPEHWNNKKISWIFNIIGSGTTPSTSNLEYYDGDVPWVNTGDLNDGYLYETSKMITDLALKDYSTLKFYPIDTLLIAMYGATIGKLSITKIIATTNQACCALAQPKNVNIKFIFYWFLANRNHIIAMAYGGGQPNISQNLIKSLRINLPEKHEQNAIVNFLDQKTAEIDDLIADKEKLIELLQEKRQAIITEAVTKGLNPNARMKDSGSEWISEIPQHWNLRRIKYLANVRNVKAVDSDNDKTYIGLENIESRTGKLLLNRNDEQQLIGETANIFKKGDVLFGKLRPYLAKCIIADFDGRCTSELLVLRTTSYILPEYLCFLMLSPKFIDVVNSSTYGAKMPRASWDFIGNLQIPLPSIKEQEEIVEYLTEFMSRIDDLISDINTQIQKLKEYRQSLISEAVTGKIDVRVFENKDEVIYSEQDSSPCRELTHVAE